jgi:sphingomyelin phosphodiesterase
MSKLSLVLFGLATLCLASGESEVSCAVCGLVVSAVQGLILANKTEAEFVQLFDTYACPLIKQKSFFTLDVCQGIVRMYAPTVWPILFDGFVQPTALCRLFHACDTDGDSIDLVRSDMKRLAREIGALRAPPLPAARKPRASSSANNAHAAPFRAGGPLRILQISDVHVDSMYVVGGNADCADPLCCRHSDAANASAQASVWGAYTCDLSPAMFVSFQQYASTLQNIDAVIVTGDLTPHDIWNETLVEQMTRITAVNAALVKTFANVAPVFIALGNHDTVACDLSQSVLPKSLLIHDDFRWLYDGIANTWSLPPAALKTLRQGGYYAAQLAPGLKLLAINSQGFNNANFYMFVNATRDVPQLNWMASELRSAQATGEKVIVAGHIPLRYATSEGASILDAFLDLLAQYNGTIVGQLFGHTHHDDFQMVGRNGVDVGVQFIAPSLTTFTNQNPSFRIFELDPTTFAFLDYVQYRANLGDAIRTGAPQWEVAYTARDEYGLADLSPASMKALIARFASNATLFDDFSQNFQAGQPKRVDARWKKQAICNMLGTTEAEVKRCLN